MSEHLSPLQLDELAAGLAPAPPHLAECPACTDRLAKLQAQNAAFLARPEAKAQLEGLAPAPPRRSVVRWLALAAPLAAGLALFLAWPEQPREDRLKGSPTVVLLDEQGVVVTRAKVGQKLTLAVGGAGFPRVLVYAVDAQGARTQLYAGELAAGARVPLMQLEVTPGTVDVFAEFKDDGRAATAHVKLEVP